MAVENTDQAPPFACDMSKIAPSERKQHIAIIEDLFGAVPFDWQMKRPL